MATSVSWKDKQTQQRQSKTEWHRVVFYGKIADIAKDYVRKGSKIHVEGRLQTLKWTDKTNNEHYTTEIIVSVGGVLTLLDSKNEATLSAVQPSEKALAKLIAAIRHLLISGHA